MSSPYEHAFGQVSGLRFRACSGLALRSIADAPFGPSTGESHIYSLDGDDAVAEFPTSGRYSGIWRGANGDVHVTHQSGVIVSRLAGESQWTIFDTELVLSGVYGLDGHDLVLAWGPGHGGKGARMVRYRGDGWEPVQAPTEPVYGMHGLDPGLLYAVGAKGSISRYDGGQWRAEGAPVTGALGSIYVANDDEVYACGTGNSHILEMSRKGWTLRGPFSLPLHRVAKCFGHLWVGAGRSGLHRLPPASETLEPVKPRVMSHHFDARQELLISGHEHIVGTSNGEDFIAAPISTFASIAATHPTMWGG